MKPCPTCGVMLAPNLADAIGNAGTDETCPKGPRKPRPLPDVAAPVYVPTTLAGLMLLGSLIKENA